MIVEKRVAEILRSLRTTDARELAKAFAFEPKRSYDLACAAVARTGDLVKAAELVESGWSHEDVVIPVRLSLEDLVRQSLVMPVIARSLDEMNALCGYTPLIAPDQAQGQDAAEPAEQTEE